MHLRIAKLLQWVFRSVKAWSEGVGPLWYQATQCTTVNIKSSKCTERSELSTNKGSQVGLRLQLMYWTSQYLNITIDVAFSILTETTETCGVGYIGRIAFSQSFAFPGQNFNSNSLSRLESVYVQFSRLVRVHCIIGNRNWLLVYSSVCTLYLKLSVDL